MEKDKERQSIRTGVKLLFCLLVSGFVFLIACQAVEPEKRAYPQVIGIDWQKEEQRYTVWMHMASLAEDTGQGKRTVFYRFGWGADPYCLRSDQGTVSGYRTCKSSNFWYLSPGKQGEIKRSAYGNGVGEQPRKQSLYFHNRQSFGTVAGRGRAGDLTGRFSYRVV